MIDTLTRMAGFLILLAVSLALIILMGTAAGVRLTRHRSRLTFGTAIARAMPADPGEVSPPFECETTWSVDRPDGIALPVWDLRGDHPDGPTAIIVHDWGSSRYASLVIANRLRRACKRIICFDLRGHGDFTDAAALDRRDVEDLNDLITRVDAHDLVLLGFGYGGALVQRTTAGQRRCIVRPPASMRTMIEAHWIEQRFPAPRLFMPLVLKTRRLLGHEHWGDIADIDVLLPDVDVTSCVDDLLDSLDQVPHKDVQPKPEQIDEHLAS